MNIGITVYPTYGGSGIVGSELGKELAARGHTVHFISSSLPTRLTELSERVRFHEVEMMSYPLFEHQPYTLALATKMATVAETENLDLLHVPLRDPAFDQRHPRARVAETKTLSAGHHDAARNGHHAGRRRSFVFADHALRYCAIRRRHRDFALPERSDERKFSV